MRGRRRFKTISDPGFALNLIGSDRTSSQPLPPPKLGIYTAKRHRLPITHIVGGPIAPYESAVILSVTPNHGASRMRDKNGSSEAAWQDEELSAAALPDKRLARRLRRLLDQMSAAPGKPIPAACGDWAAAKAACRFFDNPRVTEHSVLAGHFAATAARIAASEGPILILQDTTEFIYSRAQPGKIGFTKTINAGRYKAGQPKC